MRWQLLRLRWFGRPTARKRDGRHSIGSGKWLLRDLDGGRWEDEQELRALHEIVVREAARPCNCALSALRLPESGVLPYGKHCMR